MRIFFIKYLQQMLLKTAYFVNKTKYINLRIDSIYLLHTICFLRKHHNTNIDQLLDIVSIDYPNNFSRFQIIYSLNCTMYNFKIFLNCNLRHILQLPSVTNFFINACWYEREIYDVMGIQIHSNPDLRRILTDYGFNGHPLRKDFPLTGYLELVYSEKKKAIIYKPVVLIQELRTFSTNLPWNYYFIAELPKQKI